MEKSVVGHDKGALCGSAVDQPVVELGLVHRLDLLLSRARRIGKACVLGDDATRDAQSHGYSIMGEFADVFKTQHFFDIAQ
jgi:hypothetical protein